MVGGFPHRPEDSFFHHAIERLRVETSHQLIPSLFTMGGFPITRVPKHLEPRCLAAKPHLVVLQFGASDLIVPLQRNRHHHSSSGSSSSSAQRKVSAQPPGLFHLAKWQLHGLIGDALRLKPVTGQEIYLATQIELVTTLLKHQVTPVVMSPFVFGGRRSNRLARECTQRLQASIAALRGDFCECLCGARSTTAPPNAAKRWLASFARGPNGGSGGIVCESEAPDKQRGLVGKN